MDSVFLISVQPDIPYFHWQIEVMLHNFIKSGVDPRMIHVCFATSGPPSDFGKRMAEHYKPVKFFFYKKSYATDHGYIPVVVPDILQQHFSKHPELSESVVFIHDSDIIFRQLPNVAHYLSDDTCYLSDTVSYIGAEYIKTKGVPLFEAMCNSVAVNPQLVTERQEHSGGAQHLLKNIDSDFWHSVKLDSITLHRLMLDWEVEERKTLTPEQEATYHPIQNWTAGMWALLWNIWKHGMETRVVKELDFSWGTSSVPEYEACDIMHNAGVTADRSSELFYKGGFIDRIPFDHDLSYVKRDTASYKYVEAILYAKERRCA